MAKIVISITCTKDNPDKATVAMVVANAALVSSQEAIVFLSTEGVRLAVKGYADDIREEGFAPMKDLLGSFIENGGTVWVCTPCSRNATCRKTILSGTRSWSAGRRSSKPCRRERLASATENCRRSWRRKPTRHCSRSDPRPRSTGFPAARRVSRARC